MLRTADARSWSLRSQVGCSAHGDSQARCLRGRGRGQMQHHAAHAFYWPCLEGVASALRYGMISRGLQEASCCLDLERLPALGLKSASFAKAFSWREVRHAKRDVGRQERAEVLCGLQAPGADLSCRCIPLQHHARVCSSANCVHMPDAANQVLVPRPGQLCHAWPWNIQRAHDIFRVLRRESVAA